MEKEFVNGFDSWIETYNEISNIIRILIEQENNIINDMYAKTGYGLIYELSKELTDEFELENKGREWDGDYYDAIELFIENKYNVSLK